MIIIAIWTILLGFLGLYLGKSPKVQNWLKVLWRTRQWKRATIVCIAIITAIAMAYKFHPVQEETVSDSRKIFQAYAAQAALKLDSINKYSIDSACGLDHALPELAYMLPTVINSYNEIVERPTLPALHRLDDTLQIQMRGYKQFKNRGIRLIRLLQKKLGNRYAIEITGEGSTHTLQIVYTGEPWDAEQLFALPVTEAARENNIDPALLMSLIRHVSNFDFDYKGNKDARGVLALEEGEGLEQVRLGAIRLGKQLQVLSRENAIATFYPDADHDNKPEKWIRSPLTKSWVRQVLEDMEFYRSNGL